MLSQKPKILVIGGTTGSGESSVTKEIIRRYPKYRRLVTATTRSLRGKEKNGVDYYFFSKEKFKEEIIKKNIIEYTYIEKRDVYYGTYKPDLEEKINQSFDVIINPDIVGAKYYKKNFGATTIFIMPDSIENVKNRLIKREPDISEAELKKRLEYAVHEMEKESGYYDYIVINEENKLNETIKRVLDIMKEKEYELN